MLCGVDIKTAGMKYVNDKHDNHEKGPEGGKYPPGASNPLQIVLSILYFVHIEKFPVLLFTDVINGSAHLLHTRNMVIVKPVLPDGLDHVHDIIEVYGLYEITVNVIFIGLINVFL